MNYLSYTTIAEVIRVPHSWINKQMGLERFTFGSYEGGTQAHRVLQAHVVGEKIHPLLQTLPTFDTVELKDQDERCRIDVFYDSEFIITGFFDAYDTKRGDLMEAKSYKTTPWSLGRFNKLVQPRLYALSMVQQDKPAKKIYGITMPNDLEKWNDRTVRIYQMPITDRDLDMAYKFIAEGVNTIRHIKEMAYLPTTKHCGYKDCLFGCTFNKQELPIEE